MSIKNKPLTQKESAAIHKEALDATIGPRTCSSQRESRYQELGMDSYLTFGKYKGKSIEQVLETNPSYLVWLLEETHWDLDAEVINQLASKGY